MEAGSARSFPVNEEPQHERYETFGLSRPYWISPSVQAARYQQPIQHRSITILRVRSPSCISVSLLAKAGCKLWPEER